MRHKQICEGNKAADVTTVPKQPVKHTKSFSYSVSGLSDEPLIIHPGAISAILHLLTNIQSDAHEHVS